MSFLIQYKKLIKTLTGFSVVGIVVTLLSMLLILVCNELLLWNSIVSYIVSYGISIVLSYILNARFVWKKRLEIEALFRYFGVYLASMLLGTLLLWGLEHCFPYANKTILSYCVIPLTMLWNYFFVNKILSK